MIIDHALQLLFRFQLHRERSDSPRFRLAQCLFPRIAFCALCAAGHKFLSREVAVQIDAPRIGFPSCIRFLRDFDTIRIGHHYIVNLCVFQDIRRLHAADHTIVITQVILNFLHQHCRTDTLAGMQRSHNQNRRIRIRAADGKIVEAVPLHR